ncbi:hypothetical protein VNO77_11083 [Canavalia gladiata]|uniref:Uncharacterized protein n=1 Tax=Canavalia gladiata TaxID=3824 RepID=A0AAN9R2G9_CANGL
MTRDRPRNYFPEPLLKMNSHVFYCLRVLTNKQKAVADKRGRWGKIGGFGYESRIPPLRYCGLSKLNLMKQRKIGITPKTALPIPLCVRKVGGKHPRFSHPHHLPIHFSHVTSFLPVLLVLPSGF